MMIRTSDVPFDDVMLDSNHAPFHSHFRGPYLNFVLKGLDRTGQILSHPTPLSSLFTQMLGRG